MQSKNRSRIRKMLHEKLDDHGKFQRDPCVRYIGSELGVKISEVETVLIEEIRDGDIYEHDGRLMLTAKRSNQ